MGKQNQEPKPPTAEEIAKAAADDAAKAAAAAAAASSAANEGSDAAKAKEQEKPAVPQAPVILKRRGRFIGPAGRAFVSSPFGVTINCKPGEVHDLDDQFRYLWQDKSFLVYWDWFEDEREVELVADPETGRWQLPVEEATAE